MQFRTSAKSVILCAIGYFLLAKIGLQFSYSDTNSSPIWPAAGLGMYVAIFYGKIAAIGIVIGSLAANFIDFIHTSIGAQNGFFLMSLVIALGSYVQACFGAWLFSYKDSDGSFFKLHNAKNFFETMPIACLLAASIGVLSLTVFGNLPTNEAYCTWIFWYVGDLSGVFLFCTVFSLLHDDKLIFIEKVIVSCVPILATVWIFMRITPDSSMQSILFGVVGDQLLAMLTALIVFILVSYSVIKREAFS